MNIVKKLSYILDKKQKKAIAGLTVMMLLGAILETIGVSFILPFISIVISPNIIHENGTLNFFYRLFNLQSTNDFLCILTLSLILIFILKNIYLILMYRVQYTFAYNSQVKMAKKLLNAYIHQPYIDMMQVNSSDFLRTITTDNTNLFIMLTAVLQLMTELIVCFALIGLLLLVDIKMTLFLFGVLAISTVVMKYMLKPAIKKSGEDVQKYNGRMLKWINQILQGTKEILITDKYDYFESKFYKNAQQYADAMKKNNVLVQAPRLFIETTCISGILIYVLLLILNNNISGAIAQIATFAMAAVRLMPSANRINNYINFLTFYSPALDTIYTQVSKAAGNQRLIAENRDNLDCDMAGEIVVKNLTFQYPDNTKNVIDNINFIIPCGKSIGLVGSSGSGKTTLVNLLLGLLQPSSGEIWAGEKEIKNNYSHWLKKIGYIPQSIFLLDDTIKNNIAFGIKEEDIDEKRIWEVIRDAQLTDYVDSTPYKLNTMVGEQGIKLSGGQRQRIGIARALYHNPDYLFFDEATSALDTDTENAVIDAINCLKGKKTIVMITHRMSTLRNCDSIYKVADGKLMEYIG